MADARSLGKRFFEALASNDEATLREICAPDVEFVAPGIEAHAIEDVLAYNLPFATAFPDASVEVRNILEDGDTAAFEIVYSGTHTGPMVTPMGEVPATGRTIHLPGGAFIQASGDRIGSFHGYYDTGGMMAQLGMMPGAGGS